MPHDQPVIAVEAADGHCFELIHVAPEKPAASLMFMPGMGLSARQYIPLAQALGEHGIEVFIHEWRGLGSSSLRADRAIDWGYRELLELDLTAALGRTLERACDSRLLLGGHSLGSQFAALLAATRHSDCAGLVVIAGGSPYWRCYRGARALLLRTVFTALPLVARAVGHFPGRQMGFAGREARGVMADWAFTGRTGSYNVDSIDQDLEAAMAE
ncbi:MAG: alpha/beta fold hydrolase [Wenzhouxiangella sp.]|jgi:predicted alpha/beta hydrolase|nr:alpha/beta fold hydrolase [Wenzhouxiangella sp.]